MTSARRAFVAALFVAMAAQIVGAESARDLYTAALAREQPLRAAMANDEAAATILSDVRALVAAYDALVKRFPASGYADDALWQGGQLSLDAYLRFGQAHDKTIGVRLLRRLASGYPTSKLARQVPQQLAWQQVPTN